jgi:hypothetical protein
MKRFLLASLIVAAAAGSAAAQDAPQVRLSLAGGEAYAGMPFVIDLVADGFAESPAPAQPALAIPGATITALPRPAPRVSSQVMVINGNVTESRAVEFVYEYKVELAKAGEYEVPSITVTQGKLSASTPTARLRVGDVASSDDMKLELHLPDRALWVGETFPLELDLLIRKSPDNPQFSIPMFADEQTFQVAAPPVKDPRSALKFQVGTRELALPFERDESNGYTRFKFTALVTPLAAGHRDLPPAQVLAHLADDNMDYFGRSRGQLVKATDVARSIDVKSLPLTGRPDSFAGAVGTSFSIATAASRSVVQQGEPVDLDVTIKSDGRLDTLSLGKLDGQDGLPKDLFSVPPDPPAGVLSDDGKTKTFKVSVQVVGPATQIPALAFSYFDPAKAQYATIHSQPIALSVTGATVIGAADVVGAKKVAAAPTKPGVTADDASSQVVADLALSSPGDALAGPMGGGALWGVVLALYLVPLAIFAVRTWQVRTRTDREEAGEVRAARKKVAELLARARTAPARELASSLPQALRALARALGRAADDDGGVIAKLETEAFAPGAAERPLPAAVCADAEKLVARWSAAPRGSKAAAGAAIVLALIAPAVARADAGSMDTARGAYQEAMGAQSPAAKQAAFARAEAAFASAVDAAPDAPELLTDWGNAAAGAGDLGTATLAYRRALAIDPGASRARKNLAWLRERAPAGMRPAEGGTADTLFFFHKSWPRARKLVVGAAAFAIAVLLLVPWGGQRRRGRALAAIAPAAVWLMMTISILLAHGPGDDAVVVEAGVLRAADSPNAPSATSAPVPAGVEVTVVERRGGWTDVALANGATGWLPDGAVALVAPAARAK